MGHRGNFELRLPPPIRSASHPLARQTRALSKGIRERREEGLFLVEGLLRVTEALDADAPLVWLLAAADALEDGQVVALVERAHAAGVPVQPVQSSLLSRLAPSSSGSPMLAACRLPAACDDPSALLDTLGEDLIVATLGVQDPGNLGTLVRSALAFGAAGLISADGADPWNPKAVRASAGTIHRMPVGRAGDGAGLLALLRERGVRTVAALAHGGRDPSEVDWRGRVALLLGAEVAGLPPDATEGANCVTIPLQQNVESLSVAVAGSILLALASLERSTPRRGQR
jgi:TrmH family RNA methyltransferase